MYQPPSGQDPNQPPGYTPPPGYGDASQPYGAPPNYQPPSGMPPYGTQPPPPGYAPPGYAPQGYPPPGYAPPGYVMPMAQQSNGLATASLVLGILVFLFGFLTGIPAVITGHMALNRINQNPMLGGKGMAITGLVLGYLSILGLVCLAGLLISGAFSAAHISTSTYP